jgi:3-keto-L-gulonate-6-phosphate decarboxylase
MKLQISFDLVDLEKAIAVANDVHEFADILEIGTLLIYAHGLSVVDQFRRTFANKMIFTDTKIVDRGKESASLFAKAKMNWISVMAGTNKNVIHGTCSTAHELGAKVMLDLIDAAEYGQAALEAKNLGIDALLLHEPYDVEAPLAFLDKWELVRSNTQLPIYISANITRQNIEDILKVKPDGIIIGNTITQAENPKEEAQFFYDVCKAVKAE